MKALGCIIAIFGGVLCIVSFVLFGATIFRAAQARQERVFPLELGQKLNTELIRVDTSRLCMVAVKAKVRSEHTRSIHVDDGDHRVLDYDFPFRYTIYDSKGTVLLSENVDFAQGNGKASIVSDEDIRESDGSMEIKNDYEKFTPPPMGEIRIEAQLDPDGTYHASAEMPQLIVYDHVSQHMKSFAIGLILVSIGGFSAMSGLAIFLFGLLRKSNPGNPSS